MIAMNEKISVIVPIYNSGKFLHKCLDSIVNQSYKNIEIILINDGSIDNSKSICESYASNDKRIIFINDTNHGVSYARNKGIVLSHGEYIMFVDSDDWLELDACEVLIKSIKNDIDIVFGMMTRVNGNIKTKLNYKLDTNKVYSKEDIKLFKKSILGFTKNEDKIYFPYNEGPCCKLYRKDIIINNNIFFDSEVKIGEDGLFNFMVYDSCNKIMFVNKEIYNYYQNASSAMNSIDKDKIDNYFKLFDKYNLIIDKSIYYDNLNVFIVKQLYRILRDYVFVFDDKKCFFELAKNNYVKMCLNNNGTYSIKYKIILKLFSTKNYNLNKIFYKLLYVIIKLRKC